jgi:hypothetical protein
MAWICACPAGICCPQRHLCVRQRSRGSSVSGPTPIRWIAAFRHASFAANAPGRGYSAHCWPTPARLCPTRSRSWSRPCHCTCSGSVRAASIKRPTSRAARRRRCSCRRHRRRWSDGAPPMCKARCLRSRAAPTSPGRFAPRARCPGCASRWSMTCSPPAARWRPHPQRCSAPARPSWNCGSWRVPCARAATASAARRAAGAAQA